jgi:hypothetical protein
VKLMKEVCGGAMWMAPEDNAGKRILNSLQLSQVGFRDAVENRIAVVEAGLNKGNCDCFGNVVSEGSCECDEEHGCDGRRIYRLMRRVY